MGIDLESYVGKQVDIKLDGSHAGCGKITKEKNNFYIEDSNLTTNPNIYYVTNYLLGDTSIDKRTYQITSEKVVAIRELPKPQKKK